MMKRVVSAAAFLMLLCGFVILVRPYVLQVKRSAESERAVRTFEQRISDVEYTPSESLPQPSESQTSSQSSAVRPSQATQPSEQQAFAELHERFEEYNEQIFLDRQTDLRDVFSYSSSSFDLASFGVTDDLIGYISIEKMNVRIPMYIGSGDENLSRGAAIMNGTSMPVGGVNTNCVIAAHRLPGFLGDIELLEPGDIVTLHTLWGEMEYRVEKSIVIDPFDNDKIKIIPDRDMITLLTCHPYLVNSHRYLVYCERIGSAEDEPIAADDSVTSDSSDNNTHDPDFSPQPPVTSDTPGNTQPIQAQALPDGLPFESSADDIRSENILRISGIALTFIFMTIFVIMIISQRKKRRNEAL